jgi:hypothetical protein
VLSVILLLIFSPTQTSATVWSGICFKWKSQKIVRYIHSFLRNQKDVFRTFDFIKLFWLYSDTHCPYQCDMSTMKERKEPIRGDNFFAWSLKRVGVGWENRIEFPKTILVTPNEVQNILDFIFFSITTLFHFCVKTGNWVLTRNHKNEVRVYSFNNTKITIDFIPT